MALRRQLARLTKLLVDKEKISFAEAQSRLEGLKLRIVVGDDAVEPAAQMAVLTAVAVASRSFIGGVAVSGALALPLNAALPLQATTLGEAAKLLGATEDDAEVAARISIGTPAGTATSDIVAWWDGWRAGASRGTPGIGAGDNPLAGIAAGALAVGMAFFLTNGTNLEEDLVLDLWPAGTGAAPRFAEVFLPGAFWLIGLGNLGQAFLWALTALPYADPKKVFVVLQDHDRISEENWATSILVREETYGLLKTKVAEQWAEAKGFNVRRVDRKLLPSDRLDDGDPQLALSGVDKIAVRKMMADTGFGCVIDAGLGRDADSFDRYRVTVFGEPSNMTKHFAELNDVVGDGGVPPDEAYQRLMTQIGHCGTAAIAGAAIAAPFVSSVVAAIAISRAVAVASGCTCPANEVGSFSSIGSRRVAPHVETHSRGILHAGHPRMLS